MSVTQIGGPQFGNRTAIAVQERTAEALNLPANGSFGSAPIHAESRKLIAFKSGRGRGAVSSSEIGLQGRRVLIVEDETLVSMLMEDILMDFGCIVVGPAARLEDALTKAREEESLDIALLDVNLAGKRSFPVADILAERGVPFIFVSGYGEQALEPPHQNRPVLQKPFSPEAIAEIIANVLKG
jgi:CheY-like chemotaxis protein